MGSELSSSVSSGPVECHPGAEMNDAPALLSRDLAAITGIARKSMDRTIACEDEPPRQRLKRNSCVASSSSEPIFQHSVGPWKSASKLQPPTLSTRELEFDGEATIRLIHGDPDARHMLRYCARGRTEAVGRRATRAGRSHNQRVGAPGWRGVGLENVTENSTPPESSSRSSSVWCM